ncbi:hypothetical protein [Paenibacillus cucumis (ex Kampfer et al. 2016)]|uniref:Uncharacterized protein n=1 Tax=Paenibacillus cucumis (ex Kampfer et al. 2016) TaxID=1776858 RepID=A0ABS7KS83_9BACL|nr:hypothetical protein [Paenibacillus cucumis (ex Kampfer et al. 2016)]MBY0206786.1 hypothetical protein [Paenibacillus cucumis (ex Kampfer et al. 2016)]
MRHSITIFGRIQFQGLTDDKYDQFKYLDIFCEGKMHRLNYILDWEGVDGRNKPGKEELASEILQRTHLASWKKGNSEYVEPIKELIESKGMSLEQLPVDMIHAAYKLLLNARNSEKNIQEYLDELEISTPSEFRLWIRENRNTRHLKLGSTYL